MPCLEKSRSRAVLVVGPVASVSSLSAETISCGPDEYANARCHAQEWEFQQFARIKNLVDVRVQIDPN